MSAGQQDKAWRGRVMMWVISTRSAHTKLLGRRFSPFIVSHATIVELSAVRHGRARETFASPHIPTPARPKKIKTGNDLPSRQGSPTLQAERTSGGQSEQRPVLSPLRELCEQGGKGWRTTASRCNCFSCKLISFPRVSVMATMSVDSRKSPQAAGRQK